MNRPRKQQVAKTTGCPDEVRCLWCALLTVYKAVGHAMVNEVAPSKHEGFWSGA